MGGSSTKELTESPQGGIVNIKKSPSMVERSKEEEKKWQDIEKFCVNNSKN